jgi:uncharacterized secreted protein with C-terminal beta-propeller domain
MMVTVTVAAPSTIVPVSYTAIKHGLYERDLPAENQTPITIVDPGNENELGRAETVHDEDCGQLETYSDEEELKNKVDEANQNIIDATRHLGIRSWGNTAWLTGGFTLAMADMESVDYSNTNIQVEGVDEPDIVKTDGEYLYIVSGEEIVILKAYPGKEARVLSKIQMSLGTQDLFLSDSRLVVFERGYTVNGYGTYVKVFDISNRSSPELVQNVSFSGHYVDSRLIDDYVYMVFIEYIWDWIYLPESRESFRLLRLPVIVNNGEATKISVKGLCDIGYPAQSYGVTLVASLNLNDKTVRYKAYLTDGAQEMYVSENHIYLTGWNTAYFATNNVAMWNQWYQQTIIHRISIDEGASEYAGNGTVQGYILNQFSMDELEGYFRVATSESYRQTNVYVLDEDLEVVGSLEGLAPNERMYSARFVGDRCYLVTFKKVDPFFVIDLSDPESPTVLGELKIPGYSEYLHPYDENHIIGLGIDAYDMGSFAWFQGVKLSLFDVTDVENPTEISKYNIGDRGTTSPALHDHKAFMFSKSKNLLIIPISLFEIDESEYPHGVPPNAYGKFVWQGAYVFSLTLEDGFKFKGRITHSENGEEHRDCYWGWGVMWYVEGEAVKSTCVLRSLYIEDWIYTISEGMVKVNQMDSLTEIKAIEL